MDNVPTTITEDLIMKRGERGWIYRRQEGMAFEPGLGVMWEHKSRGFLLMVGKVYLWVRYSGRAKKLFVRAGWHRQEELSP